MLLRDLVPIIQLSVSPVIVISGIGLVLLSMTNRYGRVIDKAWHHLERVKHVAPEHKPEVLSQIRIVYARCRGLRAAISLACVSMLLIALLIGLLFIFNLLHLEMAIMLGVLFAASMVTLSGSLVYFILDINTSLKVLSLEVEMLQADMTRELADRSKKLTSSAIC